MAINRHDSIAEHHAIKDHERLIKILQASLDRVASKRTKQWWESYLRGVIAFRGVGIPAIREQIAAWRTGNGISAWAVGEQLKLALRLFASSVAEDKLAGVLYLQDYLYDQAPWQGLLKRYELLYRQGLVFDWNTNDWFCVRVLGPTIRLNGPACARTIAAWHKATNLWQARSSVVAFVPVVAERRYHPLIYRSCRSLVRRDERFAKTGAGWVLRDLSRHDHVGVLSFVDQHLRDFSLEALRNALKYAEAGKRRDRERGLKMLLNGNRDR